MPSYDQLFDLVRDPTFTKRVKYALYEQAVTILASQGNQKQKAWAQTVLQDNFHPSLHLMMMQIVATQPVSTKGDQVLDSELQTVVASLVQNFVQMAAGAM